jgi:ABC-2 type transport system ATP-binding protein
VRVDAVSKWFGGVVAVSEVSFAVGPGVTAVLGPNGAGKSTLLRLLCGLTAPSQGTVRVFGADPRADAAARSRIGLVPQQETMFDTHTPFAFVRLAGILHGVAEPAAAARRSLGVVELDPDDTRKITTYSKGMRQRVKVAAALIHDPAVLVLDEPLTGLDPRQRRHMIDLFHRLGDEGRCVLVSSHVLDEVERFGSRVLVLAKGRLAATGDFRAIRDLMDDRPHRIQIVTDAPAVLAGALLGAGSVTGVRLISNDTVHIETTDVARLRALVATSAVECGVHLREFAPLDDDLDSVFRYLVGGR